MIAAVLNSPFNFGAPPGGDPYFASVVLGLHLDGTDGSTTITDVKGNTCAAVNGAAISTAQSKFGGASLLLDGTNDHVQITNPGAAFDLGSSDFTFDWWFRSANVATPSSQPIWAWRNTAGSSVAQLAPFLRSGALRLILSFDGSTVATLAAFGAASMSLSNNTWHFCRMTRSGSDFKLYIDGTQRGSTYTNATAFTNLSGDCWLGRRHTVYYPGNIDDFLVTIGVARDGAEVPSAEFLNS